MIQRRIRYNCKIKSNHISFLQTYFQREQLRMVVVLMKMVGKDPFVQENTNAVQQKIIDKVRDQVIDRYYEHSMSYFTKMFKEWRRVQKEHQEASPKKGAEAEIKVGDESIGNAMSKFFSKKIWHFSEVNYQIQLTPE